MFYLLVIYFNIKANVIQFSVLHYRITALSSGEFILQGLPQHKFPSPIQLINSIDGSSLACKPILPCHATIGQCLPPTHWGLTVDQVKARIMVKAREWGIENELLNQLDDDLHFTGEVSPITKQLINKTIHEIQPWLVQQFCH